MMCKKTNFWKYMVLTVFFLSFVFSIFKYDNLALVAAFFLFLGFAYFATHHLYLNIFKKKNIPHHPNLTDRQKLKIALRALRYYANTDMWHWGQGIPKIDNEPYGGKNGQDTHKYNAFGIAPDQDGWELAQSTLDEIGER